eukprot:Gb_39303 [translate_table: standard]
MADNFMGKVNALGGRLKVGGAEVGRKMSAGMSSMSFKMKEIFQVPTEADKIVEEATSENMFEPDWASNMNICDMVNLERLSGQDVVRGIKKRIVMKNPRIQYLALVLIETCVKNCEKMFSEVASERVLDEMVKMIDDPQTIVSNREKTLKLIEAWGESPEQLRYLPVFEETYKSLKSRGIRFPGRDNESLAPIFTPPETLARTVSSTPPVGNLNRSLAEQPSLNDVLVPHSKALSQEQIKEVFDVAHNSLELLSTILSSSPKQEVLKDELTSTLVEQCRQSQATVRRIAESAGDSEPLLFEALNVNDEIQRVLANYEETVKNPTFNSVQSSEPALIPIRVDEEDSPRAGQENALFRNRISLKASNGRPPSEEEAALADLDEMIFGKGGSSRDEDSKKHNRSDLMSF